MFWAVLCWAIGLTLAFLPWQANVLVAAFAGAPLLARAFSGPYAFAPFTSGKTAVKPLKRYMPWVYLALLLWNVGATWWVWNSTAAGATAAFVLNALFQLLPWWAMRTVQRRKPGSLVWPLMTWVAGQVAWEHLHMHWDLSWSWLNLGNALAFQHPLAQWYSITGTLGGSLWLWSCNALLAYTLIRWQQYAVAARNKQVVLTVLAWAVPICISLVMYFSTSPSQPQTEVVVVQPNIDPYLEKFSGGREGAQLQVQKMVELSTPLLTDSTAFLLWPETSIPYPIMVDADAPANDPVVQNLLAWLQRYPHTQLVAGINTYRLLNGPALQADPNAKPEYITYNSAIALQYGTAPRLYHKSRLVPGVEQLPYPELFSLLGPLAIDLGGVVGSLGKQDTASVFAQQNTMARTAPIICYESIYGSWVGQFARSGAQFISIITNDAWWGNTPGHVQHYHYAKLRAIEQRQWVARSANTGISGFINNRGDDVVTRTDYNVPAALKQKVGLSDSTTVYALLGDALGYMAVAATLLLLVLSRVMTGTKTS